MIITKNMTFAAGHQLYDPALTEEVNEELFGKCFRPHGHNYHVHVEIEGDPMPDGMILNYYRISDVINRLDHRNLNAILSVLTTAENIAIWIWEELQVASVGRSIERISVTVKETDSSSATYDGRVH